MMTGLEFPQISPIMFSIGPLVVRWYSMAYLIGILAGWYLLNRNIRKNDLGLSKQSRRFGLLSDLGNYSRRPAGDMPFSTAAGQCGKNRGISWKSGKAECLSMAAF